jgi:hypothetical protein
VGAATHLHPAEPEAVAAGEDVTTDRQRFVVPAIAVLALLALAIGFRQLARPTFFLDGTTYDDGAYFGTAIRLAYGVIPYRDFVQVQPPGIPLLLLPFALIGRAVGTRDAMGMVRVLTVLVTGANVVLACLLVRNRGLVAVLLAGGLLATYPAVIATERSLQIEPYLVLFCLLGALAVFTDGHLVSGWRRMALGGLAFGFAGTTKVWAIVPALVLAALCARQVRSRLLPFVGGVAAGFVVPCLPFFALAPHAFLHDILFQLHRVEPVRTALSFRASVMLGMWTGAGRPAFGSGVRADLVWAVIIGVTALVVVLSFVVRSALRPRALDVFALSSTVLVVLMLLWPQEFYFHYAVFLVPFAALTIGLAAGRLLGAPGGDAYSPVVAACLSVLLVGGLAVHGFHFATTWESDPGSLSTAMTRIVPPGACVVTDDPTVTITANRFVSTDPECPALVDAQGTDLALADGRAIGAGGEKNPTLRAAWLAAFSRADYIVLNQNWAKRVPLEGALARYLATHFRLVYPPSHSHLQTRIFKRVAASRGSAPVST